jgi:hypothetical protein
VTSLTFHLGSSPFNGAADAGVSEGIKLCRGIERGHKSTLAKSCVSQIEGRRVFKRPSEFNKNSLRQMSDCLRKELLQVPKAETIALMEEASEN